MDGQEAESEATELIGPKEILFRAVIDNDYDHGANLIKTSGISFKLNRDSKERSEESTDWQKYCHSAEDCVSKRDPSTQHRYGVVEFTVGDVVAEAPLEVNHTPHKGVGGYDIAHASIVLARDPPGPGESSTLWKQARTEARQQLNHCHRVVKPIPQPSS